MRPRHRSEGKPDANASTAGPAAPSPRRLSANTKALLPLIAAMILVSAFAASRSANFFSTTNFQYIFEDIAVLGVLGVGATLLLIAGQLDLSVGSGVSLGTVVIAEILTKGGTQLESIVVVFAVFLVIGGFFGSVVAFLGVPPFILTLGGLSVLEAVAQVVSQQRPIPTGLDFASLSLNKALGIPIPLLVVAGLSIAGGLVLRFTRFGRTLYAIGSNEEAAYLSGVPIARTKITVYAISGLLTALASIMMIARLGSGDPSSGVGLELEAVTAAILGGATLVGGRGTMLGTFLGVFLLGLIDNALSVAGIASSYKLLIYGVVLIAAVTWAAVQERSGSTAAAHRRIVSGLGRGRSRVRRR